MFIKKIIYLILLTASLIIAKDVPYTILISFDGFRWDYALRDLTPALDSMKHNGVHAITLRPTFPSKTFPNHTSIATGMYCDRHGIISNNFSDTLGNWNTMNNISSAENTDWYKGEAIWETLKKHDIKSAGYFWPASDINDSTRRPEYFNLYNHSKPYDERIAGIINYLQLPFNERPKFLTLYFDETDGTGHDFGPVSREIDNSIKHLDEQLSKLFMGIRQIGLEDSVNIIVVSDHGMTSVFPQNIINIESMLEGYECIYQDTGPFMTINSSADNIEHIYKVLFENQNHFKVYTKNNIPEYLHYSKDGNIYPIILSAELGWSLVTNISNKWYNKSKGNHGYENNYLDMHGIFIACGPSFKNGLKTGTLWNIDIYPLLCKIYGIEPNGNIDGKLERIEFILK